MTFNNPNDPNDLNRQNRRLPDGGRGYGGAAGWWIGALIIIFIVFVSWGGWGWGWGGWGWNGPAVHTTNTAAVNHAAPAPRTNGGG